MTADGRKRRKDRPIARRIQQARFRDPDRTPDAFDLDLNQRMNWALIHDLATARFILQRDDVLLLGRKSSPEPVGQILGPGRITEKWKCGCGPFRGLGCGTDS